MSDGIPETREERLERLIQRQLDGELSPPERAELAAILASDPAARRRHEEYVALEGLLFAVGSADRAEDSPAEDRAHSTAPCDRARGRGERIASIPTRRRLEPVLAALLLAAVILAGIAAPPGPHRSGDSRVAPVAAREELRITDLSEGHLAVALPCENPNVQIVWLYRTEPRPEERTP